MRKRGQPAAWRRQPKETGGFDMTSMIDVTFLLIVFFLCTVDLARKEQAELVLPRITQCVSVEAEAGRLIVNVLRDGTVRVGGRALTPDELTRLLRYRAFCGRDRPLLLRVDARARYGNVQAILSRCMSLGLWNIGFGGQADNDMAKERGDACR